MAFEVRFLVVERSRFSRAVLVIGRLEGDCACLFIRSHKVVVSHRTRWRKRFLAQRTTAQIRAIRSFSTLIIIVCNTRKICNPHC